MGEQQFFSSLDLVQNEMKKKQHKKQHCDIHVKLTSYKHIS